MQDFGKGGAGAQGAVAILLVALLTSTIRAELLYFADGGRVQAPAVVRDDAVRLDGPDGVVEFRRSDFRKIVPGHWPASEWPARRQAALRGDVAARYAAAWWALENGLTPEAETLLRAIHAEDPAQPRAGSGERGAGSGLRAIHADDPAQQAVARMVAALDRLDRPCADPALDRFRAALGQSFETARSAHVVLLHQHSAADAAERLDVLERVARTFFLMLAARGVELPVPAARLPAAWFADQEDYLRFLRDHHAGAFLSTRGYYHPTFGAVVAFDARSAKDQRAARRALEDRRAELDRFEAAIDTLPTRGRLRFALAGEPARTLNRTEARSALQRLRRDVARRQLLLACDRRAIDLGTAAHELIHQLVAATGLFRAHDDAPHWLHEGLAAQFEVVRGGRWAGVGRAHDLRLPDWRAIHPAPPLEPLVRDAGFGHGYDRALYAQAWGLVYFLRHERAEPFVRFLDLLRAPDAETPRGPDRTLDSFKRALGDDLRTVERRWHEFLKDVETPLEECDTG